MAKKSYGIEWCTIRLNKSDKKAFDAWAKDKIDDIYELEGHLLNAGYKVSRSYDMDSDCYIVTVTGKPDTPHNGGKGYTSRSSDLVEAVVMALYKHWALADGGDWSKIATSENNWG